MGRRYAPLSAAKLHIKSLSEGIAPSRTEPNNERARADSVFLLFTNETGHTRQTLQLSDADLIDSSKGAN
jgi:hypothetical protein